MCQCWLGQDHSTAASASFAARIAQDPAQLGELRGRVGFFAGAKAKAERRNAERAADAVAPSLERIGAAEAGAAQDYRATVEAQRKADATPIPKLSERAEAAVAALAAATDEKVRAALWRGVMADKAINAELRQFSAAVQRRFGETPYVPCGAAADWSKRRPMPREHRVALAAISRTVHTLQEGRFASANQTEAARLVERQALGYRRGLKP
jgi:hypothetical protein